MNEVEFFIRRLNSDAGIPTYSQLDFLIGVNICTHYIYEEIYSQYIYLINNAII